MLLQIDPVLKAALLGPLGQVNSTGLVIGMHSTPSSIYILHLAPTKDTSSPDAIPGAVPSPSLLTHHTRQLLRMLPGGVDLVGIYSVTDSPPSPPPTPLFSSLVKNMSGKFANYFTDGNKSPIWLQYDRTKGTWKGQSLTGTPLEVEVKECQVLRVEADVDLGGVVVQQEVVSDKFEVKEGVDRVVGVWKETLPTLMTLFDSKLPSATEKYVETENVSLLVDKLPSSFLNRDKGRDFINHLELRGKMHLVAYLVEGGSTERAGEALTSDLLRSLSSRLTLHTESLIEEDATIESSSSNQVYHEVPRRVFVELIKDRGILLSDYIFPGEGPRDCCQSFGDIVGLGWVEEGDICEGREGVGDLHSSTHGSMEELAESIGKLQQKTGNSWILWSVAVIGIVAVVLGLIINWK